MESGSTVPDSGITLAAAHITIPDSSATHTLSATLSARTSAIGVSGAVHTPDRDVHSSSGQANAIPTPIGVVSGANLSIPGDTDVDMALPMPERDPALFDGKFLFFPLIFDINIYVLPEPDLDIEIDLQGSSRSHGGHLHGNARGNNFNFADRHEHHPEDLEKLPVTGYVNYYLSDCDPSTLTDICAAKLSGSFQHTKQKTVGPILTRLVRLYPSGKNGG